jgi:hypothetical protein
MGFNRGFQFFAVIGLLRQSDVYRTPCYFDRFGLMPYEYLTLDISSTSNAFEARISTLHLRGGSNSQVPKGPNAKLLPEPDDIRVHYPMRGLPEPAHYDLKKVLRARCVDQWSGRRVYVTEAVNNGGVGDPVGRRFDRYTWESTIRIGTMKYGSGNNSVARITGDDKVQLWGKWHFQGQAIGVFQGLYSMHMDYGPYQVLLLVTHGASLLMEQCEARCFGGK